MRGSLGGQNNRTLYRITLAIQHYIGGRGEEGIAFIASEVFDFLSIYCRLSKFLILTQRHAPEKLRRKHRHNRRAHANGHTHTHTRVSLRTLARALADASDAHKRNLKHKVPMPCNNRLQTVVNSYKPFYKPTTNCCKLSTNREIKFKE